MTPQLLVKNADNSGMTLVRFPFSAVPHVYSVEVESETLTRVAELVQPYIETGNLTAVHEVLSGDRWLENHDLLRHHPLADQIQPTALEQIAVGISLGSQFDENAFISMQVFLTVFSGYIEEYPKIAERPRRIQAPFAAAAAKNDNSSWRPAESDGNRLRRMTSGFLELNEELDKLHIHNRTIVGAEHTIRELRSRRLTMQEAALLDKEEWDSDYDMIVRTVLQKKMDDIFSKLRRNLFESFPTHVRTHLKARDQEEIAVLALYLAHGRSSWLDSLKEGAEIGGDDPKLWFACSADLAHQLSHLLGMGYHPDSPLWPGDCVKFLHVMAAERAEKNINALPWPEKIQAKIEARINRWRRRGR